MLAATVASAVFVPRYLYAIRMLCYASTPAQATQQHDSDSAALSAPGPAAAPCTTLAAQCSLGWLLRRWLIRHADMLIGATCVAAAMQAPSALGLVLAAGSLVTALQHGFSCHSVAMAATKRWHRRAAVLLSADSADASNSSSERSRVPADPSTDRLFINEQGKAFRAECAQSDRSLARLMDATTALLQVLVAAWLMAQYILQVAWVRDRLFDASPPLLPWLLLWLGLPVAGEGPTQVPHLTLEAMLRMKVLVLVATALRYKAQRWQQKLPAAVREAAGAHWPCPLFWPPKQAPGSMLAADSQQGGMLAAAAGARGPGLGSHAAAAGAGVEAGEALAWEELEPVLRRAGQLVSPLTALIIKVCSWVQIR